MATRAVIMSPIGLVHRVLIQGDGADGTGCGSKLPRDHVAHMAPVRPVQALVYHLDECQLPGCWDPGAWRRFLEGSKR